MTQKELQVVAGDSAMGCLKQTRLFRSADIVFQRDPLSCGPLTSVDPLERWRRLRDAYWDEVYGTTENVRAGARPQERPDLVPLVERPEVLLSAEVVNVWLGVSLDNQLFLAWLLELVRLIGLDPQRIRIIQFERHPVTGDPAMDVGDLEPAAAVAHPTPALLPGSAVADLRAAWAAITAPEPTSLLKYIEEHKDSPTVFHRAFARILGRFPRRDNGLNRWEFELLKRVPESGTTAEALIGTTLRECGAELDHVGGTYVSDRLRRLASSKIPEPLLALEGPPDFWKCTVALTARGKDVLNDKANFVEMNGLDEWVGGIHLQSATRQVWFLQGESLVSSAVPPKGV